MNVVFCGNGIWKFIDPPSADKANNKTATQEKDWASAYSSLSMEKTGRVSVMSLRTPRKLWKKQGDLYRSVLEATIDAKLAHFRHILTTNQESDIE